MPHDTDPMPLPPGPEGAGHTPPPDAVPPPEEQAPQGVPLDLPEIDDIGDLADMELSSLSEIELPPIDDELPEYPQAEVVPTEEDPAGGVSFDMPDVKGADVEYGDQTLGVAFADLAGLSGFSGLMPPPVAEAAQVPPDGEEWESTRTVEPASGPIPLAEAFAVEDVPMAGSPSDVIPVADVVTPGSDDSATEIGNLEPLSPVAPASGWYDPPSNDLGVPVVTAESATDPHTDDVAARIEAQQVGYGESSDIFAGGPIPTASAADISDVISATAYPSAEGVPDSDPPHFAIPPAETTRASDVALSFDQPPGGSTIHDPAAAADLPVADEVYDATEISDVFDSARLADAPRLPDDSTEETDIGSPPLGVGSHEASSILSDLDSNSEHSPGDSSSIRLESPGLDITLTDEPIDPSLAQSFDLTVADEPGPANFDIVSGDPSGSGSGGQSGETTDWRNQSGSDLFSEARTPPQTYLPGESGQVFPFGDMPTTEQGSLSSAASSIFSGGQPPPASDSGNLGADLPVADVDSDPQELADFSDHPDPALADSSTFHTPVDEDADDGMVNLVGDELPVREKGSDSGMIDWSRTNMDQTTMGGQASGGDAYSSDDFPSEAVGPDPEVPTEDLPVPGVLDEAPKPGAKPAKPRKPTTKTPTPVPVTDSDPSSIEMEWVAGSGESETVPGTKPIRGRGTPGPATDEPAASPVNKRAIAGIFLGLLIGTGATIGVVSSGAFSSPPETAKNGGPSGTTTPPAALLTAADATAALDAGNPAKALKTIEATGTATPEAKAARGEALFFTRVRELASSDQPIPANDPKLMQARADLKAVVDDPEATKTPDGEKAAVRAMLHLGLTHEAAGDFAAARQVYEDGVKKFPKSASLFRTSLKRLIATAPAIDGNSFKLPPADVEQLAFAVVVLFAADGPAPAGEEATEPEEAFWDAINAAVGGRFADAVGFITTAKKLHVERAKKRAGAGPNRLTDPNEMVFTRCCDELKNFWSIKGAIYKDPAIAALVKKDGIEKALEQLASAEKRAADSVRLTADLKVATEKLTIAEKALQAEKTNLIDVQKALLAEKEAVAKLDKDLKAEKDAVAKLDKDLKAEKDVTLKVEKDLIAEKVVTTKLEKDLKASNETVTDLNGKLKKADEAVLAAVKSRKDAEDALMAIAKELQGVKLLPDNYDTAQLIAATKSAAARATGPDFSTLIPRGMAGVVGLPLTTGAFLDLADRANKFAAEARAAEEKLAKATADFKKESDKIKLEHDAAIMVLKEKNATEVKALNDKFAIELKKANDANGIKIKEIVEKHLVDVKKLNDDHTVALKKQSESYEIEVKKLQAEVKVQKDLVVATIKKARDDLANALTPSQALDMWLPLLVGLRREVDAAPAIDSANRALKTADPNSEDEAKAWTVTGLALLVKGDTNGALAMFVKATNSPAYKLAVNKEWASAAHMGLISITDPTAPIRRVPSEPKRDVVAAARALDAGITAYKAGRYADAVKIFTNAVWHDESDPVAWYFLGASHWGVGNIEAARADFREGSLREKNRADPVRKIDAALAPIQGPARDALDATRP